MLCVRTDVGGLRLSLKYREIISSKERERQESHLEGHPGMLEVTHMQHTGRWDSITVVACRETEGDSDDEIICWA